MHRLLAVCVVAWCSPFTGAADPGQPNKDYQRFVRKQAADLRAKDEPPSSLDQWKARNAQLRKKLLTAWGGFPSSPCPLDPKNYGELKRDGYTVRKLTFQTRPGIRMTANLYLPEKKGKLPAILMVHGHCRGAKQDPSVQARCIGAAKLGFIVLGVDAFGAGERGVGTKLGEYHGDMTAATLLPTGLPLSGLQVYENMRAVDYLLTLPEVDKNRIGITGASGGGNQTMYAGAYDERFKCVVPVCSVGNYQAYLLTACCMCEVVPGALKFTEEGSILGLAAPRGLLVINATRDGVQFSVGEAKKSIGHAQPIYQLFNKPANIRQAIFEAPHSYNKAMRETMYGWMTLHLKGEGDGSPIPEPTMKTENPEDLRCFPGDTRPKDWVTLPQFAAAEARKVLAARKQPQTTEEFLKWKETKRRTLIEKTLGGFPNTPLSLVSAKPATETGIKHIQFEPEPGIHLAATVEPGKADSPLAILLNLEGSEKAASSDLAKEVRAAGWKLAFLELRGTGKLAYPREKVNRAPDHHSAEWGLWLGRPLLGQWTFDVKRCIDAIAKVEGKLPSEIIVIGEGPAGAIALCAAATEDRITKAAAVGTLASFVSDVPYESQRLGIIVPGMLRDVGDMADIAALAAPKQIVIAGGVAGNGKPLTAEQLDSAYTTASTAWKLLSRSKKLGISEKLSPAQVIAAIK